MSSPVQRIVPRVHCVAQQIGSVRSLLPIVKKPVLPTTSSTASSRQAHHFSTTAAKMTHDTTNFKDALKNRRTIYQLQKRSTISDAKIKEVLNLAIHDVPSAFNSQSTRLVALLHDQHDKFWDIVEGKLKPIVEKSGGDWQKTADRIAGFRNAYATILFYEDSKVIKDWQEKMAAYADKFPQWSEHTSAMHQYTLWTAFEAEGLGGNLQHYNPLPDEEVSRTWGVPKEWDLKAQLVIGTPVEGARENLPDKAQGGIEKRAWIFGA